MNNTFTCDKCKETFHKGWSDAEAEKEYYMSDWNIPDDDIGCLCDDCFEEFKVWYSSLTPEDHKRIRDGKND